MPSPARWTSSSAADGRRRRASRTDPASDEASECAAHAIRLEPARANRGHPFLRTAHRIVSSRQPPRKAVRLIAWSGYRATVSVSASQSSCGALQRRLRVRRHAGSTAIVTRGRRNRCAGSSSPMIRCTSAKSCCRSASVGGRGLRAASGRRSAPPTVWRARLPRVPDVEAAAAQPELRVERRVGRARLDAEVDALVVTLRRQRPQSTWLERDDVDRDAHWRSCSWISVAVRSRSVAALRDDREPRRLPRPRPRACRRRCDRSSPTARAARGRARGRADTAAPPPSTRSVARGDRTVDRHRGAEIDRVDDRLAIDGVGDRLAERGARAATAAPSACRRGDRLNQSKLGSRPMPTSMIWSAPWSLDAGAARRCPRAGSAVRHQVDLAGPRRSASVFWSGSDLQRSAHRGRAGGCRARPCASSAGCGRRRAAARRRARSGRTGRGRPSRDGGVPAAHALPNVPAVERRFELVPRTGSAGSSSSRTPGANGAGSVTDDGARVGRGERQRLSADHHGRGERAVDRRVVEHAGR